MSNFIAIYMTGITTLLAYYVIRAIRRLDILEFCKTHKREMNQLQDNVLNYGFMVEGMMRDVEEYMETMGIKAEKPKKLRYKRK